MNSDLIELPVFPLPNVVFFPNTLLPLHIFEPRYHLMVREVLEQDSEIGIVLAKSGQEEGSDTFEIGGMGKITDYKKLEDGNYNILVSGRRRYRIVEVERFFPYRIARVEILNEILPDSETCEELAKQLVMAFTDLVRAQGQHVAAQLLRQLDFPTVVNTVCSSVNLDDRGRQRLLEVDDLQIRARTILLILEQLRGRCELIEDFDHLRPKDPRAN